MKAKGQKKKEGIFIGVLAVVTAIICLLVESPSTCFLYPHFSGTDSSIFQYIGREWALNGRIPYRDAFDHKGPLLFFLNAVGFWLTGNRYGILIVQIVFLAFSLVIVYRSCRLQYRVLPSLGIVALYLLCFCYFCSEGNLSEEYSLVFLNAGIYYVLNFYIFGEKEHNIVYAFVYGICFGAMLLMRVNNAILLMGMCFGIFLELVLHRKWKNLFKNILWGGIGIGIVLLPFCIYFGIYGAEYDMWNATLFFNLKYSQNASDWAISKEALLDMVTYSITAVCTAAVSLVHWKKNRDTMSVGCLVGIIVSAITLWNGRRYKHYFMLYIVLIPILFYMIADMRGKVKRAFYFWGLAVCMLLMLTVGSPVKKIMGNIENAYRSIERNGEIKGSLRDNYYETYERIAEMIPVDERQKVAGYNIPAHFWLETGMDCCYKYFVFHDAHSAIDENIKEEMTKLFLSGYADWIVVENVIGNLEIREYVSQNYDMVLVEEGAILYRKK